MYNRRMRANGLNSPRAGMIPIAEPVSRRQANARIGARQETRSEIMIRPVVWER